MRHVDSIDINFLLGKTVIYGDSYYEEDQTKLMATWKARLTDP